MKQGANRVRCEHWYFDIKHFSAQMTQVNISYIVVQIEMFCERGEGICVETLLDYTGHGHGVGPTITSSIIYP